MKILIATPCYQWLSPYYVNSLTATLRSSKFDIALSLAPGDSILPRARNKLLKQALDGHYDYCVFIDADQAWEPARLYDMLATTEDIVGAMVPLKQDRLQFAFCAIEKAEPNGQGLVECEWIGMGLTAISLNAARRLWRESEKYSEKVGSPKDQRAVFRHTIEDGLMIGEDVALCRQWRRMGGKVYADTRFIAPHHGEKLYKVEGM